MKHFVVFVLLLICVTSGQAQTVIAHHYNDFDTFATLLTGTYLWSAVYGGLARTQNYADRAKPEIFTSANSALPSDYVSCLASDGEELLWAGTDQGLTRWNDGVWTIFTKDNSGLLSNEISCLDLTDTGTLWVGTDVGVSCLQDDTWTSVETESAVQALEFDTTTGNLWLGLDGGRIAHLTGDSLVEVLHIPLFESYPGHFEGNSVNDLAIDHQGRLWAALASGLECYSGGSWTHYSPEDLKLIGVPNAVAIDRTGVVWTGGVGLSYFDGSKWIEARPDESMIANVHSMEPLERKHGFYLSVSAAEVAEIGGGLHFVDVDTDDLAATAVQVIRNNVFPELKIVESHWQHVEDIPEDAWWDIEIFGDPARFIVASSLLGSPLGAGRQVWYDVAGDVFHGQGVELLPQPIPDLSEFFPADGAVVYDPDLSELDLFWSALSGGDRRTCERLIAQGFDVNRYAEEFSQGFMQDIEYFYPNDTSWLYYTEEEVAREVRDMAHFRVRELTLLKSCGLRLPRKAELLSAAIECDMPELVIEAIRQY